ncbi:hypothetical protein [Thermus thermophilus]|uniref:hypothetical protein n=1 Tax=Thermus thermophilus TaxID=274 RepID=UPI001CC7D67B|nr:hypothetical protein [Thermus thermophilus]
MQFTERTGLNTPANGRPGEPGIVKPPATLPELKADEAKKGEYAEHRRWHLRFAEQTSKPPTPREAPGG